jgi:mono/diheme cytochrome c family protein
MRNPLFRLAATGALTLVLAVASLVVWLDDDASGANSASSSTDIAARGETLFFAKGCAGCHRILEVGVQSIGPDLTLLADRAGEQREGMSAEEYVRESIRYPDAFIALGTTNGPFGMPVIPMTDAQLDALVAFLLQKR